jgi:LmbE family N-acetylglucosaminyl deacetylase
MTPKSRVILVLSPHTDDGELGCGGTMARLAEDGARIHYVAFSKGSAIDREVLAAVRHLGVHQGGLVVYDYPTRYFHERRQDILQEIINLRDRIQPDLVFCPSSTDTHQDHQVVAAEAERAFKSCTLLGYELPWNATTFETRCFWPLEKRHVAAKVAAVGCYATQSAKQYTRPEFLWGAAVMRGVSLGGGARFAEAFEVVRWVVQSS